MARSPRSGFRRAPFLSLAGAKLVVEAATFSSARDLRLITALGADPVKRGVLSVEGLEALRDAGFELRSAPNLHAKATVVDDHWGLAGSGNLTAAGLGGRGTANLELGVVLDRRQVSIAARRFGHWWKAATPILDEDLAEYARWTPARGGGSGSSAGPMHGDPIPVAAGRELSRLIAERPSRRPDRRYWLKMLYYDERELDRWWEEMTWVSRRARVESGRRQSLGLVD